MVLADSSTSPVAPYRLETTNIHASNLSVFAERHHVLTAMGLSKIGTFDSPVPNCAIDFHQYDPADEVEVWYSNRPAVYTQRDHLKLAHDGQTLMGVAVFEDSQEHLTAQTRATYDAVFAACDQLGYPYLCRMWNYMPHINDIDAHGLERYRAFCRGRAEAFFDDAHYGERFLPAGTGIGSQGGPVQVIFMATADATRINIENPKQMPAYHYPNQYGPKSPSFARATWMGKDRGNLLFVSGTASIIGHETVHSGDIERQTLTSLENIAHLMSQENLARYQIEGNAQLMDLDQVKVYVRRQDDLNAVKALCRQHLNPNAYVVYLGADICRKDLLVEIEGLAHLQIT